MTADEEFELKKTYLSRSKRGADIKSNLSWFDRQTAIKDYIDDLGNRYSRDFSKFDLLIDDDAEFWKKMNSQDFWKKVNSQDFWDKVNSRWPDCAEPAGLPLFGGNIQTLICLLKSIKFDQTFSLLICHHFSRKV